MGTAHGLFLAVARRERERETLDFAVAVRLLVVTVRFVATAFVVEAVRGVSFRLAVARLLLIAVALLLADAFFFAVLLLAVALLLLLAESVNSTGKPTAAEEAKDFCHEAWEELARRSNKENRRKCWDFAMVPATGHTSMEGFLENLDR